MTENLTDLAHTMTPGQLDKLRDWHDRTHQDGCEVVHEPCALSRLLDEVARLRDGIRTMCERWDRTNPDGSAFEVTSDFRDLLDGKERGRTVGGYPSSGRHASTLNPPPSGPAPGGKR